MINILEELLMNEFADYAVIYGHVLKSSSPIKNNKWNYFVLKKGPLKREALKYYKRYYVTIVSEKYIPENFEIKVIEKIEALTKLRKTEDDILYSYEQKGNDETIVEIATITFYETVKRCG